MLQRLPTLFLLLLTLTSCSSYDYYPPDPCVEKTRIQLKHAEDLARESDTFKAQGNYEEAIKTLSQSISLVTSRPSCRALVFNGEAALANNFLQLGLMRWDHAKQYEDARQNFADAYQYAAKAYPRKKELESTALYTLLYAHAALGEVEKAEKDLPKLRNLSPDLAQKLEKQIKVLPQTTQQLDPSQRLMTPPAENPPNQTTGEPEKTNTATEKTAESTKLTEQGNIFYNQKNYAKAMEHWSAAANLGNAAARYNVGMLYEFGFGVTKDERQAIKWYQLAGQQGIVEAQAKVGAAYMLGAGGLTKNSQEGRKWLASAAEKGSYDGQYLLGAYYLGSFGDKPDMNQAVIWLAKAGMQKNAQPVNDLGPLLFKGMVPKARYPEVVTMLQKWADADNTAAQIYLARMQETGLAMPVSKVKAHSWYSLALDMIQPDPEPWGDDLITVLSAGGIPTHTALSRSIAALEKKMTTQELAQSKKIADAFRAAHSASGK